MSIGSLGDVVFEVSSEKVKTLRDMQRQGTARFATHEIIGKKPLREFLGPGLEKITFQIQLSASLGVDPASEMKTLRELRDKGEALEFVLGGSAVGEELWTIEDLSEEWSRINGQGTIIFATVSVTLQEYPRDPAGTAGGSGTDTASGGEEDNGT